jgi:hypothetical protein
MLKKIFFAVFISIEIGSFMYAQISPGLIASIQTYDVPVVHKIIQGTAFTKDDKKKLSDFSQNVINKCKTSLVAQHSTANFELTLKLIGSSLLLILGLTITALPVGGTRVYSSTATLCCEALGIPITVGSAYLIYDSFITRKETLEKLDQNVQDAIKIKLLIDSAKVE